MRFVLMNPKLRNSKSNLSWDNYDLIP